MKQEIKNLAMEDTVRNAKRTLPIILFFELYMIITWYFSFPHDGSFKNTGYLYGYITLFLITAIALGAYCVLGKDIKKNCSILDIMQQSYGAFFVLWSLYFTYIGSEFRNSFSLLIYFTIIVMVPVCCYIHPLFWAGIETSSAIFVIILARHHESHFNSFLTNFAIFTVISIISVTSLYRIRQNSYRRQIELDHDRILVHQYAYSDLLTSLPNRRSYTEDMLKISKYDLPDNLVLASFDLNGLKIANDSHGHDMGDALLRDGSQYLAECFLNYGEVYRVGGDEFTGIFHANQADLENAAITLNDLCNQWTKNHAVTLSFAYGFASRKEYPSASFQELETRADDLMYENKVKYHASTMRK